MPAGSFAHQPVPSPEGLCGEDADLDSWAGKWGARGPGGEGGGGAICCGGCACNFLSLNVKLKLEHRRRFCAIFTSRACCVGFMSWPWFELERMGANAAVHYATMPADLLMKPLTMVQASARQCARRTTTHRRKPQTRRCSDAKARRPADAQACRLAHANRHAFAHAGKQT